MTPSLWEVNAVVIELSEQRQVAREENDSFYDSKSIKKAFV